MSIRIILSHIKSFFFKYIAITKIEKGSVDAAATIPKGQNEQNAYRSSQTKKEKEISTGTGRRE